ncbi:MAG: hypothetical protein E7555_03205 [Ruminococcaceae bacterium]|nr:hypothetical protein [Oscillospiraceae bacterium]
MSFADFLEKSDGIHAVKEAVSGTTLVDEKSNSYVSRLKTIDTDIKADAFVCQLSTNDATKEKPLGKVSDRFDINSFDTQTVAGAIEYIIAYAQDTWNCPVIFYTQAKYDSEYYGEMVKLLLEIQKKWDIHISISGTMKKSITSQRRSENSTSSTTSTPQKRATKSGGSPRFRKFYMKL